jgi:radical SAM protein with 4Fe4S-binding SPASM domain
MGDLSAKRGELTLAEHVRILDEISAEGCLWLLYTGGEVFARRDFLDIYTAAKERGFLVTIFTNGTLITPRIADELAKWRPFTIEITLYGHTRETYEKLTGIPGSHARARRGIQLLLERGLPLKLKTVAVSINKHEVLDIKRYAEEELGVEFKFDAMMNPRIDCSQSPLDVRLDPEEVVELDLKDPRREQAWREFMGRTNRLPRSTGEVYHCGGGVRGFAIDPEGKMSICVLSHADHYDLRKGSFREGWEGFLGQVRARKITRLTKCTACHLKSLCGMCPANGEMDSGDPENPVDFFCQVAHLRAEVCGHRPPPHGDCEYCEGGSGHARLLESAARLRERRPAERVDRPGALRLLPVLENRDEGGCSGGCPSCAASDHLH